MSSPHARPRHSRSTDQRGVAYPAPLVILSVIAIAMAALAFVVTGNDSGDEEIRTAAQPAPTSETTEAETEAPEPEPTEEPEPEIDRTQIVVEVYNNSGIRGLAAGAAGTASGAGWQVVGSDNWVGTIPSSTVYFPERLQREAELLAADLEITRIMPAVDPMRGDRLTVILTSDFA